MADGPAADGRLPVVVLGGFLGSGKTTLLARRFAGPAAARTAFLVNDFGAVGLDHRLLGTARAPVLLAGGCVCCALREDLVAALRALVDRRQGGEALDRVVLETSGVADPGALVAAVAEHPMLSHHVVVSRVVVTVDALHGLQALDAEPEARAQASAADELVITKADLVPEADLAPLAGALRALNPVAPISLAVDGVAEPSPRWPAATGRRAASPAGTGDLPRSHTDGIEAHCVTSDRPLDWAAFSVWLSMLLHARGRDVLRVKGIVDVEGSGPVALDAVQRVVHPPRHLDAAAGGRPAELVFITRGIAPGSIERSLRAFAAISSRARTRRPSPARGSP